MKKNGKRYRRLQKEKEMRKKTCPVQRVRICQEVDDINIAYLAMGHIITYNPIMKDAVETKAEYIKRIGRYLKVAGWSRRKYESAAFDAYKKIITDAAESDEYHDISYYKYFILFDLFHITAYDFKRTDPEKLKRVSDVYRNDFSGVLEYNIVDEIFRMVSNPERKIKQMLSDSRFAAEREYLELIHKNLRFMKKEPLGVMVTATMSAGKSTFINALAGKYVCLSQNMACTSKIHCIVNKSFEDGFSAEYDHDLVLTAGREELLNDNELNTSDKIVVSTNFTGGLSEQRIIVNDSPGVNYSRNKDHRIITDRLIKARNYNLLIYIMNASQLATNDESEHLDYVKKVIGRTPVLFIINQIDTFQVEEENVEDAIKRQVEMLKQKGFKDPAVCPVSAKAAYLAKQFSVGTLSKSEARELYIYIDKLEQMKLVDYYARAFKDIVVKDAENEETQLVKTSGLAYIEKIIIAMCKGGNKNGSGMR